ncbi:MAG: flavodoxin family protein [Proteobacteria bacterium]|nr:flavodoxin family protein [Pseudomonadota bacterium]
MKSLIVYSSQTGNTKKLADVCHDTLTGDTDIYHVNEAPEPDSYDLIAVGFWLQQGKPDPLSMDYLSRIPKGKKIFLFATHAAAKGSDHATQAMDYAVTLLKEPTIVGTFSCQGEANPKILEKAKGKPQPPAWLKDAPQAVGHPDTADMNALKQMIKNI